MESHEINRSTIVRPSITSDIDYIACNMRPADVAEVHAAGGWDPWEALFHGFTGSDQPWTIEIEGRPAAMFGVAPLGDAWPRQGALWLLGTPLLETQGFALARHAWTWIAAISADYDAVGNWVDTRNEVHVRFLEYLGFAFGKPQPYGPYGLPFAPFSQIIKTCASL